jgi:hypothetical protein
MYEGNPTYQGPVNQFWSATIHYFHRNYEKSEVASFNVILFGGSNVV